MNKNSIYFKLIVSVFIFFFSLAFLANNSDASPPVDSDYFTGLKPRSIGPAGMSGRIACVDVVDTHPKIIYVGAATGGIWKSVDGGVTWKPLFDHQNTSSIGDITVDPLNPETIWVGTGEANPRNSAGVGRGVFKSLDGGENWQFLGLEKTERISRVLVDPHHPETVFVAAMGTTWGENPERGIYKTTDGGKTWTKVLYVDERTGAADLVMDPGNPHRLLAAMWEHRRWPWFFRSGGPGSGLYLSTDGGENWKKLTHKQGLPEGDWGRIGLAFSRSRPQIVYALVEAEKSALCRSEDRGNTWTIVNDEPGVSPRPFYYADIRVHPQQENTVYRLSGSLDVSLDGGQTFKRLMPFFSVHGDFHELWIHPHHGNFMVVGGDGGIAISYDKGQHWNFVQNLPLGQFYHISVDLENPYHIYGGLQDNGSWRGPSRVLRGRSLFNFHWQPVGWGDGFGTLPSFKNPHTGYSMSQGGWLVRFNTETGELKDIRPPSPRGIQLRFNWNAGIAIDPLDPQTLYYGSQFLHKSTDEGQNWDIISPDLTTNDPEKQKQAQSGGLTKDVTHAENHCTIVSISPSPVQKGVIWVGTDDGKVQLTRNSGRSWIDLSQKFIEKNSRSVPAGTWVSHIEASHHDTGTAYVVFDDHRRANWKPYVFITQDYGETWKNLSASNIDGFIHVIKEDLVHKNLIFLGTEFGLYISFDRGKNWMKWTNGMPTVPVRDMVIHPLDGDLVIGTHGRSVYILDDIQPLRELTEDIKGKNLHLFSVADAYQFRTSFLSPGYLTPGDREFQGENRPYGALITYSIGPYTPDTESKAQQNHRMKQPDSPEGKNDDSAKTNAEEMLSVEILDSSGQVIRTVEGPTAPGLHRVHWDLRHDPFETLHDPFQGFFPPAGPYALPGSYTVRINLEDTVVEKTLTVLEDPRIRVSPTARREKHDLIMKNGKYMEAVREAYEKLEKSLAAVDEVISRIDQLEDKHQENLRTRAEKIKDKLRTYANSLSPPEDRSGIFKETELSLQLASLGSRLESSFDAPTAGQHREYIKLKAVAEGKFYRINRFFKEEFQKFVREVRKSGFSIFPDIEPIAVK